MAQVVLVLEVRTPSMGEVDDVGTVYDDTDPDTEYFIEQSEALGCVFLPISHPGVAAGVALTETIGGGNHNSSAKQSAMLLCMLQALA